MDDSSTPVSDDGEEDLCVSPDDGTPRNVRTVNAVVEESDPTCKIAVTNVHHHHHQHFHHEHITGNIIATGENAYIEQTGTTNVVGASSALTCDSGVHVHSHETSTSTSERIREEKEDSPVIPGDAPLAGSSLARRFFLAGLYAEKFKKAVNKRSYRQALGGITDNFKEQNLHEPGFEANPRMKKLTHFYRGEMARDASDYKQESACSVSEQQIGQGKFISPQELIEVIMNKTERNIAVVGQAGSGKTTTMRRLVRDIIKANQLIRSKTFGGLFSKAIRSFHSRFKLVHFMNVKDLGVGSLPVSARDLLFKRVLTKMSEEELQYGYDWIVYNQKEVLFVFDGLDQATWEALLNFPKIDHTDKTSTGIIMTNILSGHLFPDAKILISSREHSIASLSGELRPNVIVAMMGLRMEDIENVFNVLIQGDSEAVTKTRRHLPPPILPLCSVPLFLMFNAIIHKSDPDNCPGTMSAVLVEILRIFIRSEHMLQKRDIVVILRSLKIMAFTGHIELRVTFILPELEKYGLDQEMVRDFIIKVPGSCTLSQNLFDGDFRIFFSHQMLQEQFAAMYICDKEINDFSSFAQSELILPHWSVVRRLVCGLLSNPRNLESEFFKVPERAEKWGIFKETLRRQYEVAKDSSERLELLALLHESRDSDLIQSLVCEINFVHQTFTPTGMHAISSVIRSCEHFPLLRMEDCNLDIELMKILAQTTQDSHLKVDEIVFGKLENDLGALVLAVKLGRRFQAEALEVLRPSTMYGTVAEVVELSKFPCSVKIEMMEIDNGIFQVAGLSMASWRSARIVDGADRLDSCEDTKATITTMYLGQMEGEILPHETASICNCFIVKNINMRRWSAENMKIFDTSLRSANVTVLNIYKNYGLRRNGGFIAFGSVVSHCKATDLLMIDCRLRGTDVNDFMKGATGDTKIVMLNVGGNKELRLKNGFVAVGSAVRQFRVEFVSMTWCGLQGSDLKDFMKGAGDIKVEKMNVSGNDSLRKEGGFRMLGSAVSRFQVRKLLMRRCSPTSNNLKEFQEGAGVTKIRYLDLSYNEVNRRRMVEVTRQSYLGKEGLSEIIRIVQRNQVETLRVKGCDFESNQLEKFRKSIPDGVEFIC